MRSLVGVFREPEYSPGRVEDDAAILERTRDALADRGIAVRLGGIELLADGAPTAVLAMCQSERALAALDRAAAGAAVMNHPDAIRACHRHETVRRLAAAGIPFPATRLVATAAGRPLDVPAPCWVKRGDVHAMTGDDVTLAATPDDIEAALADFAARGIERAALQAHVEGVVVKFYGVADGRFFRCFTLDGAVPAPLPLLWDAARAGAEALGLDIFGGDLVVTPEERPVLIDVNDWPSFARCRDEAADAIAGYVLDRLSDAAPAARGQHG
ncbi:MAG: hypothetical protein B6D46_16190 [Polyangiaceae bacterium UTPRO1]|jgi:glutathione synthase/RimK-type ligase-like ATP-grasp enzyme|nr:hypothetical protein [Myxococcales bacterium]OQY64642.1 MAG: hypothetical protein B6D46_16190 [Polyangiaceae bacterium UTPRO1]